MDDELEFLLDFEDDEESSDEKGTSGKGNFGEEDSDIKEDVEKEYDSFVYPACSSKANIIDDLYNPEEILKKEYILLYDPENVFLPYKSILTKDVSISLLGSGLIVNRKISSINLSMIKNEKAEDLKKLKSYLKDYEKSNEELSTFGNDFVFTDKNNKRNNNNNSNKKYQKK